MDCRNLGYMDVYRLPSMALDTGFPAGMTVYLSVCITMRAGKGMTLNVYNQKIIAF